jgi:hypothetical protein
MNASATSAASEPKKSMSAMIVRVRLELRLKRSVRDVRNSGVDVLLIHTMSTDLFVDACYESSNMAI